MFCTYIQPVTMYKTTDGKLFEHEKDAKKAEAEMQYEMSPLTILGKDDNFHDIPLDKLLTWIRKNPELMRDILDLSEYNWD